MKSTILGLWVVLVALVVAADGVSVITSLRNEIVSHLGGSECVSKMKELCPSMVDEISLKMMETNLAKCNDLLDGTPEKEELETACQLPEWVHGLPTKCMDRLIKSCPYWCAYKDTFQQGRNCCAKNGYPRMDVIDRLCGSGSSLVQESSAETLDSLIQVSSSCFDEECGSDSDCCEIDPVCHQAGTCVECRSDAACFAMFGKSFKICDTDGICMPCRADSDCEDGKVCQYGFCEVYEPPKCFPGDATVRQENGETKFVHQLRLGDMIQTGPGKFEPVLFINKHENSISTMMSFNLATNRTFRVTSEHVVVIDRDSRIMEVIAEDVKITDSFLNAMTGDKLQIHKITSVESRETVYSPFTPSQRLAIDGVVVSTQGAGNTSFFRQFLLAIAIRFSQLMHAVLSEENYAIYDNLIPQGFTRYNLAAYFRDGFLSSLMAVFGKV